MSWAPPHSSHSHKRCTGRDFGQRAAESQTTKAVYKHLHDSDRLFLSIYAFYIGLMTNNMLNAKKKKKPSKANKVFVCAANQLGGGSSNVLIVQDTIRT